MQDRCDQVVGFLFPHKCGRIIKIGCPYCEDGLRNPSTSFYRTANNPYRTERNLYANYGTYRNQDWGMDFTDADGASLVLENYPEFEQDLGAS